MALTNTPAPVANRIEAKAREIYEANRAKVAGRPAWEALNRNDPWDMGMIKHAYRLAATDLLASIPNSAPSTGTAA
ncbi:hypothetical protein [Nitrospirillum sp. BR 11828]|uniref:hypothetical protein n=1 Tax=Nitrospirillum sp. BR 11828 TaxID=3104325 RepID=UPI002ACAEB45|nr:hypothetical protein [Nitrospirillum sp. BR 11828]MDZ5647166.1 hypothetical protein [Nitrospirillum sp. BR 11828]